MEEAWTFAMYIYVIGGLVGMIGCIGLVIDAFRVSIGWGLICLFLMPAMIAFVICHWKQARRSFAIWMLGLVLIAIAVFMGVPE